MLRDKRLLTAFEGRFLHEWNWEILMQPLDCHHLYRSSSQAQKEISKAQAAHSHVTHDQKVHGNTKFYLLIRDITQADLRHQDTRLFKHITTTTQDKDPQIPRARRKANINHDLLPIPSTPLPSSFHKLSFCSLSLPQSENPKNRRPRFSFLLPLPLPPP